MLAPRLNGCRLPATCNFLELHRWGLRWAHLFLGVRCPHRSVQEVCLFVIVGAAYYQFSSTVNANVTWILTYPGTTFDGVIVAYRTSSCLVAPSGCADASGSLSPEEVLRMSIAAGETFTILVTGYNGAAGSFSLTAACDATPSSTCTT